MVFYDDVLHIYLSSISSSLHLGTLKTLREHRDSSLRLYQLIASGFHAVLCHESAIEVKSTVAKVNNDQM